MSEKKTPLPSDSKELQANLRVALEQNWLHIRHIEEGRMWFTSIYAVVVAGVLSYLGTSKAYNAWYLALFMLFFSLFGFVTAYKQRQVIKRQVDAVNRLAKPLRIEGYIELGQKGGIRLSTLFVSFYAMAVLGWFVWFLVAVLESLPMQM